MKGNTWLGRRVCSVGGEYVLCKTNLCHRRRVSIVKGENIAYDANYVVSKRQIHAAEGEFVL